MPGPKSTQNTSQSMKKIERIDSDEDIFASSSESLGAAIGKMRNTFSRQKQSQSQIPPPSPRPAISDENMDPDDTIIPTKPKITGIQSAHLQTYSKKSFKPSISGTSPTPPIVSPLSYNGPFASDEDMDAVKAQKREEWQKQLQNQQEIKKKIEESKREERERQHREQCKRDKEGRGKNQKAKEEREKNQRQKEQREREEKERVEIERVEKEREEREREERERSERQKYEREREEREKEREERREDREREARDREQQDGSGSEDSNSSAEALGESNNRNVSNREVLDAVIQHNQQMKKALRIMHQKLIAVENILATRDGDIESTPLIRPNCLPIRSEQDFNIFEDATSEATHGNVVKYFIGLGGSSLRDAIGYFIKKSIEGEFIREVTWTGDKETIRLEDTKLVRCMKAAIRRNKKIANFTDDQFSTDVMAAIKSEKQIMRNRAHLAPQRGDDHDDDDLVIPTKRGRLSKAQKAVVIQRAGFAGGGNNEQNDNP